MNDGYSILWIYCTQFLKNIKFLCLDFQISCIFGPRTVLSTQQLLNKNVLITLPAADTGEISAQRWPDSHNRITLLFLNCFQGPRRDRVGFWAHFVLSLLSSCKITFLVCLHRVTFSSSLSFINAVGDQNQKLKFTFICTKFTSFVLKHNNSLLKSF